MTKLQRASIEVDIELVSVAMTPRKSVAWALGCSFAIYFIRIVGPHAAFFVYDAIGQQFRGAPTSLSAAANLGVALALQAVAFALFCWLFRRRGVLPVTGIVAYAVTAIVLAQYVYMLWLPSYFLIEADTTIETGAWVEACTRDTPGPTSRLSDESISRIQMAVARTWCECQAHHW